MKVNTELPVPNSHNQSREMINMEKNEKELLKSYEKGEWQRVRDFNGKKKKYMEYAGNTLKKDKRLNIRISSKYLEGIQRAAIREGIPYQTLVSSIIHKFVLNH